MEIRQNLGIDFIETVRLGRIPSEIGNLTALMWLSIKSNRLSGSLLKGSKISNNKNYLFG